MNTISISKLGEIIYSKTDNSKDEAAKETSELANKFQTNRRKEDNDLYVSESFSLRASNYNEKYLKLQNQTMITTILYTIFQPVLIAIFCGFILGFITTIKSFWFNPNSSVVVKICFKISYLMIHSMLLGILI